MRLAFGVCSIHTFTTMPPSDSEDDAIDDIEFDRTTDGDDEVEEELLESLEGDLQAAAEAELASEGDDVCSHFSQWVLILN